jgi:hypothetical protein
VLLCMFGGLLKVLGERIWIKKILTVKSTVKSTDRCSFVSNWLTWASHVGSARNGQVYAGIQYRNFFIFLNFLLPLINIYVQHPFILFHISDGMSLFRF